MTDHQMLIERYAKGGRVLRDAVGGLLPKHAVARPGPGDWSCHELVVHLNDSDAIGIDRMKRVIAEPSPTLLNADEQAYVDHLHPHEQSLDDAVALFDLGRQQFARVLRQLPDDSWQRTGTHNVVGVMTLFDLLQTYTDHLEHHLTFLRAKRERLDAGA